MKGSSTALNSGGQGGGGGVRTYTAGSNSAEDLGQLP